MDCVICKGPADVQDWENGEKLVECDYCGNYRLSNVAGEVVANAQVPLDKANMLVTLARKRRASGSVPLVQEIDLIFDSDQLAS